jgi:hypothetical protein
MEYNQIIYAMFIKEMNVALNFVITLIYYECDIEFLYKLHNIINLKSTNFEFKIF